MRETEAGQFSIINFYERRFRRILPAALIVIAACLLTGFFLFDPQQLENLARSSIANNLFLSNMYFYRLVGYFDGPAELKPLLHTWTLSVEEQYYALFPLVLMLITVFGKKQYITFLIPILIISFVACVVGMSIDKSAVFYMLPTRAWELLIGSLLAIMALPNVSNSIALNGISFLGLSMIAYSIFTFSDNTPFPSVYAMTPTLGAAMVIYAGRSGTTLINSILSLRPVVFVGLISYSLYLWHWPVIVYAKLYNIVDLTSSETLILIFVIFILSVISWYLVETPFRKKKLLPYRRSLFAGAFAATTMLIISAIWVLYTGGLPDRHDFKKSADILAGDPEYRRWRSCEDIDSRINENKGLCKLGEEDGKASFLLWGDSHTAVLATAVHASARRYHATGVLAARNGCPPLLGIERTGRDSCHRFNQLMLDYLSKHPNINTVILAARWSLSVKGTHYKHEGGGPIKLVDLRSNGSNRLNNTELFERGLQRTIESIRKAGRKVVLVSPVPEVGYNVPSAHYIALITGRNLNHIIAPSITEYYRRNEEVLDFFSKLKRDASLAIVDLTPYFCDERYCSVVSEDGFALYRDEDHLSTYGARRISPAFDCLFSNGC